MRRSDLLTLVVTIALVPGVHACGESVAGPVDATIAAGSYLLESTRGFYAPKSGTITLRADGHVERRVKFQRLAWRFRHRVRANGHLRYSIRQFHLGRVCVDRTRQFEHLACQRHANA